MKTAGISGRFSMGLALALSLQLFSGHVPAAEYGAGNPVSILTEEHDGSYDILLKNSSPADMTVTVWFTRMVNASSDRELPCTDILKGGEVRKLLRISRSDASRGWDTFFMYSWRPGRNTAVPGDGSVYRLPYARGGMHMVIQGYRGRTTHFGEHEYSLDFDMPVGTPVCAAYDGVVFEVRDDYDGHGLNAQYRERNNIIRIMHEDGSVGEYVHIRKGGAKVRTGSRVRAGEIIAESGNVGYSDVPHLHFGVYVPLDGRRVKSVPVCFITAASPCERLVEGRAYQAP